MRIAGHWHVDNGGSTVNLDSMNDHCGLGKTGVHSDNLVEVVKLDQAS